MAETSEQGQEETFEVEDIKQQNEAEAVAEQEAEQLGADVAKEAGWSAEEIAKAKERGLLKDETKKPEAKKPDATKKEEGKEPQKQQPQKLELKDEELTPAQEKAFLDAFGPGTSQRGLYFRMKNERHRRQAEEALRKEWQQKFAELEAKLAQKAEEAVEGEGDEEDRPLTLKQLRRMQELERFKLERRQREQAHRGEVVKQAQVEQEEYVKSVYADYDGTMELAKDLIQNLESLIPEKHKQTRAIKLLRDMQVAAAHADKLGLDEYNSAFIAYELGQMHPRYGQAAAPDEGDDGQEPQKATDSPKESPKAPGRLNPDQMKRVQEVTQRRQPSASVPSGGGKRTLAAGEVDLKALNSMSAEQRLRFREKNPERYEQLLRG